MQLSTLIQALEDIHSIYGDIEVRVQDRDLGGYYSDTSDIDDLDVESSDKGVTCKVVIY